MPRLSPSSAQPLNSSRKPKTSPSSTPLSTLSRCRNTYGPIRSTPNTRDATRSENTASMASPTASYCGRSPPTSTKYTRHLPVQSVRDWTDRTRSADRENKYHRAPSRQWRIRMCHPEWEIHRHLVSRLTISLQFTELTTLEWA